jgi:hypothetical protein
MFENTVLSRILSFAEGIDRKAERIVSPNKEYRDVWYSAKTVGAIT